MKSICEKASVKFTKWFIFNVPGASWQQGDLKPEETQEEHKAAPALSNLPKSGELIQYDFRKNNNNEDDPVAGQELKVVSYNIFLAQNLKGVIDELSTMDPSPDVILLQEDNIYELPTETTTTTTFHHAGGAIAKALKMSCIFVNAHYRGGEESNGLYGMSILSRFKLRNTCALKCETQPWIVNEMTNTWLKGERHFPYAEIGSNDSNNVIALTSVHLPSIGKFVEKTQMMSVLFRQMKEKLKKTLSSTKAENDDNDDKELPIIIGGDMNTAPYFFRWILPFGSTDLFFSMKSETKLFRKFIKENNFMDPFSNTDGTYHLPGGGSVKLDWILFHRECFKVKTFEVQPKNKISANKEIATTAAAAASDHQWVSVTCSLA